MPRHMLDRDAWMFTAKYPDADVFLTAAALRYECCSIARKTWDLRTPRQVARFAELLLAPTCREPWFVAQLRNDAAGQIEKELELAGL